MLMVTVLVRLVTYYKELPLIKSHDPLIWYLCEVALQIKYIISPPAEDPWIPNKQDAELQ